MVEIDPEDFTPWAQEMRSRRRFRRWSVDTSAVIHVEGQPKECFVHNLSPGGASIVVERAEAFSIGTRVALTLAGFNPIPAEVRQIESGQVSLSFLQDESDELRLARFLVSQKPARRLARQNVKMEAVLTVDGVGFDCVVVDLSRFGANVLADETDRLMEGSEVMLKVVGYGEIAASVRHVKANRVGLMFLGMLEGDLPS